MLFGEVNFDAKRMAEAMGIRQADVFDMFSDGRPMSFLIKRKVAYDKKWKISENNDKYDWIDTKGNYVECRVLTKGGVNFCPNKMIGVKRSFDEVGFFQKLNFIKYYVVVDILDFPKVKMYSIKSSHIKEYYLQGMLGGGRMGRKKFLDIMKMYELKETGDE